jgi:hypothetical protein
MLYESFGDLQMPKIGFGTWKIGGSSPDRPKDARGPTAMRPAPSFDRFEAELKSPLLGADS